MQAECLNEDDLILLTFTRFSTNFCTRGVIFVLLAKLKCNLWQHKVEKMWRFLLIDTIHFTDHITFVVCSLPFPKVTSIIIGLSVITSQHSECAMKNILAVPIVIIQLTMKRDTEKYKF